MKQVETGVLPPLANRVTRRSLVRDAAATDGHVDLLDFESFYARELNPMVRLAAALTRHNGVAQEIAHDAFFDAYRRWAHVGSYDNPATWVRRAVLNRAASFHRRRLVEFRYRLRNDQPTAATQPDMPDEALWREVGRLPTRQKQVVVLHYVDQLTTDEVAEVLQISPASVKTHLQRARQTLNDRLTNGASQ